MRESNYTNRLILILGDDWRSIALHYLSLVGVAFIEGAIEHHERIINS